MDDKASKIDTVFRTQAAEFGVPGLAWWVKHGTDAPIQGGFSADENNPIDPAQSWHWGSCTKAFTATVVASLIDQGILPSGWNTTVAELLPQTSDTPIAPLKLLHLCQHRSGLIVDLPLDEEKQLAQEVSSKSFVEQRQVFLTKLAPKPLQFTPGTQFCYSNAGFVLISIMLETFLKSPWESIATKYVGEPLGMKSLGFGIPNGIVGFSEEGDPLPDAKDHAWNHASFCAHSSFEDWSKFAMIHLETLQYHLDKDSQKPHPLAPLKIGWKSSMLLHKPASPETPDEPRPAGEAPNLYAMGWSNRWNDDEPFSTELSGTLWHYGTNFVFNASVYINAPKKLVVLLAANSGSMVTRLAIRLSTEAVLEIIS